VTKARYLDLSAARNRAADGKWILDFNPLLLLATNVPPIAWIALLIWLGLETAEYLAAQGNTVIVLKRYETIGRTIEPLYRDYLLRELKDYGVEIVTRIEVEAIHTDGVLVRDAAGEERAAPADWVVLARGPKPSNELAHALRDHHPIVIGDAVQPRKIINAIEEGYLTAKGI